MTNIWTQAFEDIRKPHFEMEDPYTKLEEGKAKRDYDGDGKLESGAKEHAGAVHNAIQRKRGGKPDGQDTSSVKEETLVEVEKKTSADKKVDVMKGGKNKVVINPAIREEVEAWVSELVEEGYDLSEFTWEEMTEIYEAVELDEAAPKIIGLQPASPRMVKGYPLGSSKVHDPSKMKDKKVKRVAEETELEEGTAGMPAAGDAERVVEGPSKKLARARIQKDMADVKYNRAVATNESVGQYLSQRKNIFENLEQGLI